METEVSTRDLDVCKVAIYISVDLDEILNRNS